MIDLTDPPWLQAVALFLALVGLMIWFPIYYWRKDRQRRATTRGENGSRPGAV
jgi:hypothetical protein